MSGNDLRVHVGVLIDDVQVVKGAFALYRVDLKVSKGDNYSHDYHVFRRFSEFWKLKKDLEHDVNSELPYELSSQRYTIWGRSVRSCDPDVIEERKKELTSFLHDMLNDSFDTRWKRSPYVCQFLQLPSDWYTIPSRRKLTATDQNETLTEEELRNAEKWLEEFRNCKRIMEENRKSSRGSRSLAQLRLRLSNLENGLVFLRDNKVVGVGEIQRRENLLKVLKSDLNSSFSGTAEDRGLDSSFLVSQKPGAGRRIGETDTTMTRNNQQLLQLHKDTMKDQDEELEKLRGVIKNQKNLSLAMNQELATQNELLDMMSEDVEQTAIKLRMANRSAKRFNERS
ncbi:LAMI_0D02718g1_1 [Lachancea mirantina]|uniref:LAMI_0D02718g1_1 n=1 Tax=Lachancea mirantina TaxID=1230905 RepID=A0A1G4J9C8_9SACH|nr:LAMI_0D02718g1_1 [Lachancea mirantina]